MDALIMAHTTGTQAPLGRGVKNIRKQSDKHRDDSRLEIIPLLCIASLSLSLIHIVEFGGPSAFLCVVKTPPCTYGKKRKMMMKRVAAGKE
jgi:hypothetical protein